MSKEKKKTVMPKLRFPEFREAGEWTKKALGEACEILNNRRKPISENNRTKGKYPYYGASGIVDYVDDYIFDERLLLIGEDGAKWGAFEKTAFIAEGKYWVNNHAHVLKAIALNDSLLENYLVMLDIIPYITGAAPPKLTLGKLKEIPIPFPINRDEQQKIATLLTTLDELISAQGEKIKALQAHKKGLMQRLFPAEGERVPRVRFGEFEGEWEEKTLGQNAIKIGSGITPTGGDKNYKKEGRPFVRSQNVGWGYLILEDIAFIDEATHSTFSSTEIKQSDVLLNITGASIGRSAIADARISGGNVNQHVCIIRTKEELSPFYLNQYLLSNNGQSQIDSFQSGGNRQGLNFAQISFLSIPLPPSFAEQQKIAATLTSLDDLIATQVQKMEALKRQKKGLMQQLFPSPEGASSANDGA